MVIRGSSLIGRPGGTRRAAESLSRSLPSSASDRISAAVNVLLMLATANGVSALTRTPPPMSASPETPVQDEPSGKMIVAETPGIASLTRTRSSVAASRVSRTALGSGDADGVGDDEGASDEMATWDDDGAGA